MASHDSSLSLADGITAVSTLPLRPHDQSPADWTGIQLLLFFYPGFNAYFTLPANIFQNMLVVTYPIYNMGVTENQKSFTGEIHAFIAPCNAMYFCTVSKAMPAYDTRLRHMIGEASVTKPVRKGGTSLAE